MKNPIKTHFTRAALALTFLLAFPSVAFAAPPDLTGAGVIAALKSNPSYSNRPYSETYNLGATGLRGWIYIDGNNAGDYGLLTAPSRQILVTVASAPANAVLAVDDVILGAMAASTGTVPPFTSDCRKALGVAIGEAERTGAGTLRVSRWRAGVTTDVNIPMAIMGDYTSTAPFTCPKSALILANARIKLVSQLKADSNFLNSGYGGAIKGLALLASVAPGDADYAIVQTRLKSFADALAANTLQPWGMEWWDWSYMNIFMSEYYLRTVADGAPDASILAGISRYTVAMAKGQSRYGTFSHGGTPRKPDGSLHGTVTPYGPVNAAGIPTNIAIVMGKKALVAGGQAIDPEIDPAIQRGSDFFRYYMNKGSIPYGEHEPWAGGHSSNGKDPMCAVLFGLQDNRPAEAEYFARMSVAGWIGREYGHSGQGLSYLWGAMGANIGGPTAVAKYMENFRWHTDLVRRTDGSFSYDGQEQYGGGETEDGSYLGKCGYNDMNPTATYILSFGVSLQRLYITGRNAIPANTLSPAKVTDAIAAATYKLDCPAFTTAQLLADLSAYDPVVRNSAATQLASRTLTPTELNNLIASITNGSTLSNDPNTRMGACQALGARQATGALTALGQRLSDTDLWVRGKAAQALRSYPAATASAQRDTMLTAFVANATDPEVIVWNDPVQIANNYLSFALFGDSVYGNGWNHIAAYTINASKNLLYPAVKAGLKQPDSNPRLGVADFARNYLTLADAQALTPDLFAAATTEALADTMWHGEARAAGIQAVAKYKPAEAIPIALSMMEVAPGYGWGAHHFQIAALNVMSSFGDSARWTLPALRQYALTWETTSSEYAVLNNTIASIDAAITSPAGMINLVAVATPQVVVTPVSTAKAITLAGTTPRGGVTFSNVTTPAHGTLTGTAPNLIYTPTAGYTGPDYFTFKVSDSLTTSETGTVSLIMGTAGTGLKGEYFDNTNFTNLKLTRTDLAVNFDWGTGTPDALVGADTFSVRWSGQLLVPETGSYTFSTLNSDGARLFINGVPVINDYVDQTTSWKDGTPISLTAGQRVELQMEYYENTGSAVAKLKWRGPTMAGINGSIIAKEWLYDGTGITNRMPYAHAQTVSLIQNNPQAITLTGSGAALTPLVYSVISQPANGTLSGVAPNLTYTPAANFSGSDSFTFLVNNGFSNSDPATVSIGILAGTPTSYFWTNAVAGAWSGAFWSNAAGGAVTPAAAGSSAYSLNFNKPGTYTTTQDLNNNFAFNQLNLAGTVTFDGSNSLSSAANGTILPQINQNSASAVVINTPVNLAAMTSFGGVGGGSIATTGVISGTGGVNKDSPGTLQIYGLTPNPYSGGTIVNSGTLHLGAYINGTSPNCVNPVGTGSVTLNSGGTIEFDNVSANNPLTANGGTFYTPNGWGATWSGATTLNGAVTINAPYRLTFSGAISGAGGFTKVGGGPLALTGTNSFTGANRITSGTLSCSKAAALGTGTLDITLGAMVELNFTGTRTIAALTFNGGAPLAPGTYGSTTSPATNKNNTYFSGNGTITILPASSTALSLTSGSTPSNLGAPLTFTATVTGTAPTGNVAFYAGTTLLGTSALNGSFLAALTTSSLAVGSHSITARYAGNATHAASTSAAVAIEITSQFAAPPTNLFAVREVGSVGLTWTVSAGATGYNVKRALTNGGPYTTIGTSVVANYNDLTALDANSYYYVVSATNASGESANSASVGVMPLVPSSAKDILTFVFPGLPEAVISGTSINLTVAAGTAVTALAPTYTVSPWATGSPASGTSRNFSTPQTYTITASDSSTQTYTVTVTVAPAPLIYNFNDATLQGWNNRVWNGSAWIDLAANATTYAGTLLPASSNNGLFVPGSNAVWVSGSTDFHLNTLWLRSPQFNLNGTGDLTVQLAKGIAKTTAPANDLAVPFAAIDGGGWKGVALRRVSDGVFVLNKPRDVGNDDTFRTVTFTQAELATLDFNAAYTLELINSDRGSWGWLTMDNVSIPGSAIVALSSTTLTSSLGATGAYSSAVTFTATVAVTGGPATGTVTFKDGVTVLGTGTLASGTATFTTSTLAMGAHSITASYGGNAAFATSVSSASAYSVTAKALTIVGVTAGNKLYDATTAATLTGGTLSGVVSGETVTVTAGSGTFASANAGLRTVTAIGYALGGANAGNYSLPTQPIVPNATITARPLTVTASNQSKTYGQTVAFSSGSTLFTSSGLLNGESIGSVTLACTGGGAAAAVATYPITPGAATGGTFTATNYTIQYVDGSFLVNMASSTTTLTSSLGASAAYGSATTFTATVAVTGGPATGTVTFKDGVTVLGTGTLASGTATFTTSTLAMGAHSITASYGGNAAFATSVSSASAYSVTAKSLTIVGVTASDKNYDATIAAALSGGTLSGVVSGETVTITAGSGTFASANAGLRAVTAIGYALGGANAGNYSLPTQPLVPNATITGRPLTVTANNQSKTYGQTVAFSSGSTLFTSSGLQNGESIGSVTLACGGGDAAAAVASYPITPSAATGGTFAAGNYMIQYVDGSFTVNMALGYESWASDGAQGLTAGVNDDPSDDPDHDGFSNLMEFTLGGAPMVSSQAIRPTLTKPAGDWVFEYNRSDAAQSSATQTVEYGSDLTGWTSVPIPAASLGIVEIIPGSPTDHVKVTIPAGGTQTFVRLKVSQ